MTTNICQGHARQQLIDDAIDFLTARYKRQNFKFVKFVELPTFECSTPWICQFEDESNSKTVLVTTYNGELQTLTAAVLENIQTQLNNALKEIKSVLKVMK